MPRRQQEKTAGFRNIYFRSVTRPGLIGVPLILQMCIINVKKSLLN